MSRKSFWDAERMGLSLRVGAMAAVLGLVVLAAEQRLSQSVSAQEIAAAETMPRPVPARGAPVQATPTPSAHEDYFPSHFPEPTGDPQPLPPQF